MTLKMLPTVPVAFGSTGPSTLEQLPAVSSDPGHLLKFQQQPSYGLPGSASLVLLVHFARQVRDNLQSVHEAKRSEDEYADAGLSGLLDTLKATNGHKTQNTAARSAPQKLGHPSDLAGRALRAKKTEGMLHR